MRWLTLDSDGSSPSIILKSKRNTLNRLITLIVLACLSFLFIIAACAAQQSDRLIITMWQHHMVSGEREAIDAEIGRFRQLHPESSASFSNPLSG
ncbi:hypothetical protein [Bythopirellula polymerisocia]|uniref:Uncharacterized protein n=1 Tax=Bythopirellula polymerisocia TaxID=2528003 RepID=A0A5C6CBE1_9BACT|nr:hypothetical protein [Bythopirellula polymerisocia]TWU20716.1 hypothetical protein Pla144_48830 [Bythopirellula polymerisocia]